MKKAPHLPEEILSECGAIFFTFPRNPDSILNIQLLEQRYANITSLLKSQFKPSHLFCVSGQPRVKKQVKKKLSDYYQEVLWSEVGGYLEHGLLWWSADPLGSFPPAHTQHLRDHVVGLKRTGWQTPSKTRVVQNKLKHLLNVSDYIPQLLVPSTNSLLDALCCHVTSTSWDQLFRKTLVAAGNLKGHVYGSYGIEVIFKESIPVTR